MFLHCILSAILRYLLIEEKYVNFLYLITTSKGKTLENNQTKKNNVTPGKEYGIYSSTLKIKYFFHVSGSSVYD